MAVKLKRLSVGKLSFIYYDTIVYDEHESKLIYGSFVANDKDLRDNYMELNKKNSIYLESKRRYVSVDGTKYDCEKKRQSNSDFGHMIINRRDSIEQLNDNNELLISYIYIYSEQEMFDKLYNKLYEQTSIPMLKEWMPYLCTQFVNNNFLRHLAIDTIYEQNLFECYKIQISKKQLQEIITEGIKSHEINIENCTQNSDIINLVTGLDEYLNIFGDTLAYKIQQSFIPKFVPEKDTYTQYTDYFDKYCASKNLYLYDAQKSVIQASVNNLNKNNINFIVAEMGSGSFLPS